jgi:hypothetical protein
MGQELSRDRDATGRPRNARPRDELGRPGPRDGSTPEPDPPALDPSEALAEAQRLLDDGRAFAAHEVLEAVWKATSGEERPLWRGLAQLAVGLTHRERGNEVGAAALLDRAADTLAEVAAERPYGVDVAGLRDWARRAAHDPDGAGEAPPLTARRS